MTPVQRLNSSARDPLDEEALVKADRVFSRRGRRRDLLVIGLIAAVALIVIGVVHRTPTRTRPTTPAAMTCPRVKVKMLALTAIPGGLGHAGLLVRSSVSSYEPCTISGYPTVDAGLSGQSTATATDVRIAYLGGVATRVSAPLPRLTITSRPRVASFTIQWADGNGPTCPAVDEIQFSLPGSTVVQTARSMYEPGVGNTRFMGIYCSHLSVTPLVKGSSGSAR